MSKEEILELLDEVVERLEGPALNLFHTFTAYHRAQAIVGMVIGCLFVLGAGLAIRAAIRYERASRYDDGDIPLVVFGSLSALTGIILIAINVVNAFVPQVAALKDLVPGL